MNLFSTDFVCKILKHHHVIDDKVFQQIKSREKEQRKRVQKKSATNGSGTITAVDIISSMKLKTSSDTGQALSEEMIMKTLASHWKLPFLNLDISKMTPNPISSKISEPFARKHLVIPVSISKNMLFVAVMNPMDVAALDTIRTASNMTIRPVISTKTDILKAIEQCYTLQESAKTAQKDLQAFQASVNAAGAELSKNGDSSKSAPSVSVNENGQTDKNIVSAVNLMLRYACEQRASEIHIEPKQFHSQIRFRIDGMLYDVKRLPPEIHTSMGLRFKALARMNISEKRKPQDGQTQFNFHEREMGLRISTMPMLFGEKIMIRILDPILFLRHIDDLGFSQKEFAQYQSLLSRSNGIILIAGPPGSGKTTTIYSTLDALSEQGINLTTIEDPVELPYDKFNQIALQPSMGLTFEIAIRHIVRQSADVIMIGEIRDQETAENAVNAALLGHLVISSVHTYDAPSALVRLVNVGAEPFLVESTVIGVIAQRLLRRICDNCGKAYQLSPQEMAALHFTKEDAERLSLKKGSGCMKCRGTGYFGQTAIFETMEITEELRALIHSNAGSYAIKGAAIKGGMKTLRAKAIEKMVAGITTCEEVLRVTGGLKSAKPLHFKTTIALS